MVGLVKNYIPTYSSVQMMKDGLKLNVNKNKSHVNLKTDICLCLILGRQPTTFGDSMIL